MKKISLPLPLRVGLAVFSVVLTLGGVTGIASSFVLWHGFIADFVDIHTRAVREPLAWLVSAVLPPSWPRPPSWFLDLLVIWGFSFTTLRLFLLFEGERAVLQRRAMRKWWSVPIVFLLGPVAPFYLIYAWGHLLVSEHLILIRERVEDCRGIAPLSRIGKEALQKREDALVWTTEELVEDIKKLAYYFVGMLALVVILLMINYQFGLLAGGD
ncbi:MAG: hypothetical protein EOP24_16655 [Hyphomicrobiales bacterium]|nr:MAG: hypothetical protein EOP24_16655 [Hyphomicrobiales bacterium]